MAGYPNLQNLKDFISVDSNTHDNLLGDTLKQAIEYLEDRTSKSFASADKTERQDIDPTTSSTYNVRLFKDDPRAITSVKIVLSDGTEEDAEEVKLNRMLKKASFCIPSSVDIDDIASIRITYTHGSGSSFIANGVILALAAKLAESSGISELDQRKVNRERVGDLDVAFETSLFSARGTIGSLEKINAVIDTLADVRI